jgi:hypothetical protein
MSWLNTIFQNQPNLLLLKDLVELGFPRRVISPLDDITSISTVLWLRSHTCEVRHLPFLDSLETIKKYGTLDKWGWMFSWQR